MHFFWAIQADESQAHFHPVSPVNTLIPAFKKKLGLLRNSVPNNFSLTSRI
jgi:hypothetical protein